MRLAIISALTIVSVAAFCSCDAILGSNKPKKARQASHVEATPAPYQPPAPAETQHLPKRYTGYVSSSNKKSVCIGTLCSLPDGGYRFTGSLDNVNLMGRWDLLGYSVMKDGKKVYAFTGYVDFSGVRNLPRGTKAEIVMSLDITDQYIKGSYEVGPYLTIKKNQTSVIDLRRSENQ